MRRSMFLCALTALVLSSCVKENVSDTELSNGLETITFEAKASADTKTTLVDGTKVYWLAGDLISVMGAEEPFTNALAEGEAAAKTAFTGEVATADTYYAVYPALVNTWDGTVVTTSLSTTQYPSKGTFANGYNVAVAKTTSQEKAFTFKNVLGYVKFSLAETTLRSVIVTANGGECLSGIFTVDAASDEPEVVPETGRNYVQFTQYNVRSFSEGDYYIALLPGTYSQGLTFEFENKEGVIATVRIDGPLTLEAGNIQNIGFVDGLTWGEKDASENVIWTGKFFVEGWKGCQDLAWGGFDWSKAKPGDVLKVYGGPESEGLGWWCICLKDAVSWANLPGTEQYNNPTELSVTLTQEMIDALVANNGLVLQGQDYVFTKIELIPGEGEEEDPGEETGATVLWEGEFLISGWNAMQELAWGGFDWSKAKAGNAIKVYFTTESSGSIRLARGSDWTSLPGFKEIAGYNSQYDLLGVTSLQSQLAMTLTEEDITELVDKGGLIVTGDQVTITKIELLEELVLDTEVVVWEGEETSSGYSNCQIGDEMDWVVAGLPKESAIRIYFNVSNPEWAFQVVEGHWESTWFGTNAEGNQAGEYGHCFNGGNTDATVGYAEFDVNEEMYASLTTQQYWGYALILQGDHVTFTKLSYVRK